MAKLSLLLVYSQSIRDELFLLFLEDRRFVRLLTIIHNQIYSYISVIKIRCDQMDKIANIVSSDEIV